MADIYADDATLIAKIKAEIDLDPELYLTKTKPLKTADLAFMAEVIQAYSYADLNGRLIIDRIREAAEGPGKQNGGKIQDSQVFEKLNEAASLLPDGNTKDGILKASSTLAMHVLHRHQFAHWAIRRVKGHEVFVIYSYNAKEAEKRLGHPIPPGTLVYGVVPLKSLRAELKKIDGHANYLAKSAAHLFLHKDELKAHFDEEKAKAQAAKYEAGKYKKGAKGPPKG